MTLSESVGIVVMNSVISTAVSYFMMRYFFHKHEDKIVAVENILSQTGKTVKNTISKVVDMEGKK